MWTHLILGALLAASGPQTAATPDEDDEVEVCVTVLTFWSGSASDRRAIASDPVPESFRREFGWRGCQTLDKPALLEWHLAFGTEQTSSAALAWLEQQTLAEGPGVAEFARIAKALSGASRQESSAQANAARTALDRFSFLADQYLRAAEFYHSSALLAKAAPYVDAVRLGLAALDIDRFGELSDEAAEELQRRGWVERSDYDLERWRALAIRFAIARAQLSLAPNAIAAADRSIVRYAGKPPLADELTDAALEHGGDPCAEATSPSELAAVCDREPNLPRRLATYWYYRALIDDLLDPKDKTDRAFDGQAFTNAARLMALIDGDERDHPASDPARRHDARVALLLSHAAAFARQAAARRSTSSEADYDWYPALRTLIRAERLTSPVTQPGRFRQIGVQFGTICRAMAVERCRDDAQLGREYRYLTQDLAFLDQPTP